MAYQIQHIDICEVRLNDNNPRFIKDKSFKDLVKSLKECPDLFNARPLLCNADRVILGGNMRYRAALELRYTEVPVIIMEGLTPDQEREIVIKDNGGFGSWDFEALANGWADLPLGEWGVELPENWLAEPEEAPEEEEFNAELPKEPITVLGDLYELNGHRLHCADSTDSDAVAKLMDGKKADMVFTDPPYNTKIQQGRTSSNWGIIENDNMEDADFGDFCKEFVNTAYAFTKGEGHKYFCMGWSAYDLLFQAMPQVKNCIVWVKNNFGLGHNYRPQHEFILYDGGTIEANDESNVWHEKRDSVNEYEHPTQKPVTIPSRAIKNSSKEKHIVLDLFLGSHSTLIACETMNRLCYGQELDPKYTDVGIRRWVKYMQDNNRPYTVKRNGQELSKAEIDQFFVE